MRKFLDDGRIEFGDRKPNSHEIDPRIDDDNIRADVAECVARTPSLEAAEISVSVIDGEVLLEGQVPSTQMRHALHDSVARCRGVRLIRDRLHVAGEPPPRTFDDPAGARPISPPQAEHEVQHESLASGVAAELGIATPEPVATPPGPSLWWIALAVAAVLIAFWLVYAFV